jgi:hypothetical protein
LKMYYKHRLYPPNLLPKLSAEIGDIFTAA